MSSTGNGPKLGAWSRPLRSTTEEKKGGGGGGQRSQPDGGKKKKKKNDEGVARRQSKVDSKRNGPSANRPMPKATFTIGDLIGFDRYGSASLKSKKTTKAGGNSLPGQSTALPVVDSIPVKSSFYSEFQRSGVKQKETGLVPKKKTAGKEKKPRKRRPTMARKLIEDDSVSAWIRERIVWRAVRRAIKRTSPGPAWGVNAIVQFVHSHHLDLQHLGDVVPSMQQAVSAELDTVTKSLLSELKRFQERTKAKHGSVPVNSKQFLSILECSAFVLFFIFIFFVVVCRVVYWIALDC